ncbi:MAG: phosphoglycerate mutase (2,3-diphosphoglycerate-independent) [Bacteroidetes bacterium 37-13]|nr:MAG: phosphoglycerate mutase (2,3-diphosphoglycerate-independent) [Bacteroidetes bacterium 37-13]
MNTKKVILIIMDGWGHGKNPKVSAIAQANTPFIDSLYKKYPNTELLTHGENVGLPDGQMGNSEVGHLNIGAGRIVYQELLRINNAVKNSELKQNKTLLASIQYAKENKTPLHFIGLVSDGGVHSHTKHLMALCKIAHQNGLDASQIQIHAFTDGRDTDPKSGLKFLSELLSFLDENKCGTLASVCGRYFAMDRDNRWERIKLAYDLLVHGKGEKSSNVLKTISERYTANETDEFLKPIICGEGKMIAPNDAVICFNFRTDRCREITKALTQQNFPELEMQTLPLHYTTMTVYDSTFKNVFNIFDNDDLKNTLGEVLAAHNKTQLRIAETEKYPHVTFFFSGGREKNFIGEERIMIPSPKVATYDLQPEMSAFGIADKTIEAIKNKGHDFICLNFANTDMVGHTGVFSAAVKACETVNTCVEKVVNAALENNYAILLTADHGNADFMQNEDGSPNTAHTTNPVPLFFIDKENKTAIKNGVLADIAPTILGLMDIALPKEMTGKNLLA